ncbi:MAG TPA: signlal transduction histidine kinase, LytS [Verrucomicrobiales bacterium]|nr:signlal transduction histidine kinase, LytS [Verrucomicrobiales bacterium]
MNPASLKRQTAPWVVMAAAALGLWGALVMLFAVPLALTDPASWLQAVGFAASFWSLWLVFLPAVAWLAFCLPIERRRALRNLGLHCLACLLVVATSRATFRAAASFSPRPQRSEAPGGGAPAVTRERVGSPPLAFHSFRGLRAALDVLVYWSLVGVCQAILLFRSSQERERRAAELEAKLSSAKLQALRMQINPHFLFNALNSIAVLIYVNPRAADEMLGDLCLLLRRSLDSMEEQEITLGQELSFITGYVSIEQRRFGDRLRLEVGVPGELEEALVPALILQPLVENAIRHGIEPRRGPGLISIEARREDQRLRLVVRDNGRGLPGPDAGSVRRGVGLANTEARLQALYGPEQSFSFGKGEPEGCRLEISLPFRRHPVTPSLAADEAGS